MIIQVNFVSHFVILGNRDASEIVILSRCIKSLYNRCTNQLVDHKPVIVFFIRKVLQKLTPLVMSLICSLECTDSCALTVLCYIYLEWRRFPRFAKQSCTKLIIALRFSCFQVDSTKVGISVIVIRNVSLC